MSQIRLAFVHQVLSLQSSVSTACRKFGISRKTGYKWLRRYQQEPQQPLQDHSRQPHISPRRTAERIEQAVLAVRDAYGWGPRKIHAYLRRHELPLPSMRTVGAVLKRYGRVCPTPPPAADAVHFFERARPNELWQCDFKGRVEVARQYVYPFTVLDDHSRFLFTIHPCTNQTMQTAWDVLWQVFGEFGLPDSLLCDNAFANRPATPGLSWFDARLLRLDIRPVHGRPYHPQTQGKIERLHGTLQREVWPRVRRDEVAHFAEDVQRWRTTVYNVCRPHEALGDVPPLQRWQPSPRPRPPSLPALEYPPGAIVRTVTASGDVRWQGYRFLVGHGIARQTIRIEERDQDLVLFYASKEIRCLPLRTLQRGVLL